MKDKTDDEMFIEQQKISEQFAEPAFLAGDLFGVLSPAACGYLHAVKHEKEFKKNEAVFNAGGTPSAIYILAEGEARIFYQDGASFLTATPGEILGLTEMISNLPHEASLRTVTACRFEYISRDDFLLFLQNEPAVCFRLLEIVAANLHRLYSFLH